MAQQPGTGLHWGLEDGALAAETGILKARAELIAVVGHKYRAAGGLDRQRQ